MQRKIQGGNLNHHELELECTLVEARAFHFEVHSDWLHGSRLESLHLLRLRLAVVLNLTRTLKLELENQIMMPLYSIV